MIQIPTVGQSWGNPTCFIVTKNIATLYISQEFHIYFDGGVFYSISSVKEQCKVESLFAFEPLSVVLLRNDLIYVLSLVMLTLLESKILAEILI